MVGAVSLCCYQLSAAVRQLSTGCQIIPSLYANSLLSAALQEECSELSNRGSPACMLLITPARRPITVYPCLSVFLSLSDLLSSPSLTLFHVHSCSFTFMSSHLFLSIADTCGISPVFRICQMPHDISIFTVMI